MSEADILSKNDDIPSSTSSEGTFFEPNNDVDPIDHASTPFVITAHAMESSKASIYSASFNPYIDEEDLPILATAGGNQKEESYYSLSWCYDDLEAEEKRNPYFIAAGGENGYIRIFDPASALCVQVLRGHGRAVNEIRTSPTNSSIIASASKDTTVLVWHIRNDTALLVFGGRSSHSDQILSLDWSECGRYIATCSNDHIIKLWGVEHVIEQLDKRISMVEQNGRNAVREELGREAISVYYDENMKQRKFETPFVPRKGTRYEPIRVDCSFASLDDIHTDYVDCVRFLGDYCISKGCGSDASIVVFRFGDFNRRLSSIGMESRVETTATRLYRKIIPEYTSWFVKFDIDPKRKWIMVGTTKGMLYGYKLENGFKGENPDFQLKLGDTGIRQVAFSPDGNILVAVGDGGTLHRLDRFFEEDSPLPKLANMPQFESQKRNTVKKSVESTQYKSVDGMDEMVVDADDFTDSEEEEEDQ